MNIFRYLNIYYVLDLFLIFLIFIPSNLYKFHPLIYSIILFFYIIVLRLKLNYLIINYYYSYILFLFIVGGIMILIIYFTRISSNELIIFSIKYVKFFILKIFILIFLIIFLFYLLYKYNFINLIFRFDLINFNKIYNCNYNLLYLKNLYININMELTIFLILYLFLIIIFSTLICIKLNIPMRQIIN